MSGNVFFNVDRRGKQTFQVRRDDERQLIFIRLFMRDGTTITGISDEYVFDPAALRAHPDHGRFWTDHMCWAIENRELPDVPGYCRAIYPFCPRGAPDPEMRPVFPRWISIFVPFADSPVSEMMVMCYVGEGLPMIETPARKSDRRVIERELMPRFDLELPETCAPGETIRGKIRLRGPRAVARTTAYVEASAGYLPRREIEVRDGTADIAFTALGLESGQKARIDVGFQYYRAKTAVEIEIH